MNPIHAQIREIVSKTLELPDIAYNRLNIIVHAKAHYPEYLKYEDRLNSFREWRYMGRTCPELLAQLGFFCVNQADTVQCFCCGLMLAGWRININPEQQHKHYRKRCLYLNFKENTHPEQEHLPTCVICMDKKSHYAILPCGHICSCHECLVQITRCPLCNADITALMKIFIPN